MTYALAPTSRIGILGGGQLGRMLALSAARLGLDVVIFDHTSPHDPRIVREPVELAHHKVQAANLIQGHVQHIACDDTEWASGKWTGGQTKKVRKFNWLARSHHVVMYAYASWKARWHATLLF